jgi:hypothetical protein
VVAAAWQTVAAVRQGAEHEEQVGQPDPVRPLAFPRGWERGGGLLTF